MYPEKTTVGIPLAEGVAMDEPHRRSSAIIPACDNLIFGWVWRGEPASRLLVQPVTCVGSSPSEWNYEKWAGQHTIHLIDFVFHTLNGNWRLFMSTGYGSCR